MLRARARSWRPILLSFFALGVTVLACAGALWSWIEHIPDPPEPYRSTPASPAFAAAFAEMKTLHHLPRPRHPLYAEKTGVAVEQARPTWRPHFRRIHALHRREWLAPLTTHYDDTNPHPPAGTMVHEFGIPLWDYAGRLSIETEALRREGRDQEALRTALDGMTTAALFSHRGHLWFRYYAQLTHRMPFKEAERIAAAGGGGDPAETLRRVHDLRRKWEPLLAAAALDRRREMEDLHTELKRLAELSLRERYEHIGSSGGKAPWEIVSIILTPRAALLSARQEYRLEWERQWSLPHAKRRDPAPLADALPVYGHPSLRLELDGVIDSERHRTDLALLEVALAARVFRHRTGRYPEQLRQMVPGLLPAVPLDQWDVPIVYRLENGRPLIYSFGGDGDDDHGRPPPMKYHRNARADGDRVFGRYGQ